MKMPTFSKQFLIRAGVVLFFILIAVIMLIIGRGHTLYFDNKSFESPDGQTYGSFYRVSLTGSDRKVQKLIPGDRVSCKYMGQRVGFTITVTKSNGDQSTDYKYTLNIPYSWDGAVVNLPALVAGAEPEVYLSEFIVQKVESYSGEDEEVVLDDFSVGDI